MLPWEAAPLTGRSRWFTSSGNSLRSAACSCTKQGQDQSQYADPPAHDSIMPWLDIAGKILIGQAIFGCFPEELCFPSLSTFIVAWLCQARQHQGGVLQCLLGSSCQIQVKCWLGNWLCKLLLLLAGVQELAENCRTVRCHLLQVKVSLQPPSCVDLIDARSSPAGSPLETPKASLATQL